MNNNLYNMIMSILMTILGVITCVMFYLYNFNDIHSTVGKVLVIITSCIMNIGTAVITTITVLTYLEGEDKE